MLIYHGLVDTLIVATDTINYYNDMVDQMLQQWTRPGSRQTVPRARRHYGWPGAGHLGQSGSASKLRKTASHQSASQPRTVITVKSIMKDRVASTHSRPDISPAGGADNPDNWRVENFQCQ